MIIQSGCVARQGPLTDKSFSFCQIILIQNLPNNIQDKRIKVTWCSSPLRCIADCILCIITRVTSHRIYYFSHAKLKIDIADEILQQNRPCHFSPAPCRICPDYVFFMVNFQSSGFLTRIINPGLFQRSYKWENFKFNATPQATARSAVAIKVIFILIRQ